MISFRTGTSLAEDMFDGDHFENLTGFGRRAPVDAGQAVVLEQVAHGQRGQGQVVVFRAPYRMFERLFKYLQFLVHGRNSS